MSRFNVRTLLFILIAGIAGYLFFFVLSLLDYPEDQLLALFKVSWVFEEALRKLIEHLPTITFTAVLLAFGSISRGALTPPVSAGAISKPVSKTLAVLIFFTLVYSALSIGLLPLLYQHRYNRLYSSTLATNYLRAAELAEEEEDLELAYRNYRNYLSIDEENRPIRGKLKMLEGQISIEKSENTGTGTAPGINTPRSEYRNLSVLQLLDKARQALSDNDPFTAHYLAGIVLEMEESREDARRISAEAWARIASLEPTEEEREKYRIYHRKLEGYQALTRSRPVEAYYIFRELRDLARTDPDIREYYEESLSQARQVAYFIDEAEASAATPGIPRIIFLNSGKPGGNSGNGTSEAEPGTQTLVYMDKLVYAAGDHWVHGFEILEFSGSEGLISHIHGEYARVIDHTLLLRGIDREDPERVLEPFRYTAGENGASGDISMVFEMTPSVTELGRLTRGQDFSKRLNLPALLEILPKVERFGYPRVQFEILVIMRLVRPFFFLILAILAVGLGWHLRAHGERFPFLLSPLVVLLPFILHQLVALFEYGHQLVLSWSVLFGGMALGLVVLILLETILLFFALLGISVHREL